MVTVLARSIKQKYLFLSRFINVAAAANQSEKGLITFSQSLESVTLKVSTDVRAPLTHFRMQWSGPHVVVLSRPGPY